MRLLFLQVPLNYRTMQGPGYLFTLWPWLTGSAARASRVKAAASFMNAQPVFGSLAAGSLLKRILQGDAETDANELAEWQHTISGPLGMAGDALIWDRWKPLIFSLAVLVLLMAPTFEAWLFVAPAALVVYNVPLFALRFWGLRAGYASGKQVLENLTHPLLSRWKSVAGLATAGTVGGLFAAGLSQVSRFDFLSTLQFVTALGILWFGQRRQWPLLTSLLAAVAMALLMGRFLPPVS